MALLARRYETCLWASARDCSGPGTRTKILDRNWVMHTVLHYYPLLTASLFTTPLETKRQYNACVDLGRMRQFGRWHHVFFADDDRSPFACLAREPHVTGEDGSISYHLPAISGAAALGTCSSAYLCSWPNCDLSDLEFTHPR